MRVVAVVGMVALVGRVGVVTHRDRARILIRKSEERRSRSRGGGLGYRGLGLTDSEASIGDLGRGAMREHRREGDTEREEKRLLLHDLRTICVPMYDCQVVDRR